MKLVYKTRNGRMQAELEADTQTELWAQLAAFQETFEAAMECSREGKKSDNVRFVTRTVDDNVYHEAVCMDDDKDLKYAKLSFGQHKKGGGLFPKRKDSEGKYLTHNGWQIYGKDTPKKETEAKEETKKAGAPF